MPQTQRSHRLLLEKIVGGGQTIGTCDDGRKAFVWGGLPGEDVTIRETKRKKSFIEGIVEEVHTASPERIEPREPDSYLSTSPWQIMSFEAEQRAKAELIRQAFELHNVQLKPSEIYSDGNQFAYRNKVEFSWWGDEDEQGNETLDLAFFRRGGKGKLPVDGTALAAEPINQLARQIRDELAARGVNARQLKTVLIRADQAGSCVWQLYVKDESFNVIDDEMAAGFSAQGGEVIYSDPRSPASRITKRLRKFGDVTLEDNVLGVPFRYAAESFFQVNVPVYERSLRDMKQHIQRDTEQPLLPEGSAFPAELKQDASDNHQAMKALSSRQSAVKMKADSDRARLNGLMGGDGGEATDVLNIVDLYSGVGSIGLTIGGDSPTLIEIDEHAVREMKQNIAKLGSNANVVLAPAEHALDHIHSTDIVIVDPPRAGLHGDVVERLLDVAPKRIIYLSCNPVTQARDVGLLQSKYDITYHRGYNFFPRTPHIEHLVVLNLR